MNGPDFPDCARGAFLGLALGDAYGRPLEFVGLPRVRTMPVPVVPGAFKWTDDTHMSLYLARAVLDQPAGPLDADRLGHAVGRRFVEWLHDPLTPSTAPGGTCQAGARNYERDLSWRSSGERGSDGCGAVMRVAPLAIAFYGDELTVAAEVSAQVTHGHPNALEAAIAASWMLRWAMEEQRFDAELVLRAVHRLRLDWARGGIVAESLLAALALAGRPAPQWLDESAIPPGDGGWRSPSALGLGVAAALSWGRDFALTVDRAARIGGDSDSVAAIAGMFVGGAGGVRALPAAWRDLVPERVELLRLADSLAQRGAPAAAERVVSRPTLVPDAFRGFDPSAWRELEEIEELADEEDDPPCEELVPAAPVLAARTSVSDPIQVAWLPQVLRGRIGLTLAPGKKASSATGHPWARDLELDLDRLAGLHHVGVLVSLVEDDELVELGLARLVAEASLRGVAVLRFPIRDGGTPPLGPSRFVVDVALTLARAGQHVVFHCRGGLGRAGTLAACCLVAAGELPDEAIATVRKARPGAVETKAQELFVSQFGL